MADDGNEVEVKVTSLYPEVNIAQANLFSQPNITLKTFIITLSFF